MENQSRRYKSAWLGGVILLVLMCATIFMHIDRYLVGDEVVTYGMANSTSAGWMLSQGRVRGYFESEIIGDSFAETVVNLKDFAMDIAKNRRGADYFSYQRPSESGWYSNEEITDWFALREEERFRFGDVYLNAMGDDANSFLYYMLVHLAGSVFPGISGLKWSAFIVNVCAGIAVLICLYNISRYFVKDDRARLLVCLLFGLSVGNLDIMTCLRPYMLAIALQLGLFWIHLGLYEAMKADDRKQIRKRLAGLFILYPIGYVAHYTTGLWAAALGIFTVIYIIKEMPKDKRAKNLKRYIGLGCLAILTGICLDQMSVLGLVSKLSGEGKPLFTTLAESFLIYTKLTFGGWGIFILFGVLLGINIFHSLRENEQEKKKSKNLCALEWLIAGYCLMTVLLTKSAYFKVAYPLTILVMVMEAAYFNEEVYRRHVRRWVPVLAGCAFVMISLPVVFFMKQSEAGWYDKAKEVLADAEAENIMIVRQRAEGYDTFPLLKSYDGAMVATTSEGGYEVFSEDAKLEEIEELVVIITNRKLDEKEFLIWAKETFPETEELEILDENEDRVMLKWKK